jgi:DNA-directed RNA polymerase specialized sigma24 family protein
LQKSRFSLTPAERDDLLAYLLSTAWELSRRYEPGGITFSTYAGTTLKRRAIDWLRKERGRTTWRFAGGRTYERERPVFVPLESGLDGTVGSWTGDPAADRSPDLDRVLGTRGSARARDLETLGLPAARRAPC